MTGTNARTLRDIFVIPEGRPADDYVLKLAQSVGSTLTTTVEHYVVTTAIADAFDHALGLVDNALRTGQSGAVYLFGSFGSGKSHFMAVLHGILGHADAALNKTELEPVITKYPRLREANLLRLHAHFLTADTLEQALFEQALRQIRELHPDVLPPVLHSDGGLFADADRIRADVGDQTFFERLNAAGRAGGSIDWSALTATMTWGADSYAAAIAPDANPAHRRALGQALRGTYFAGYSRNTDWLPLEDGLVVLADFAKSQNYDGVVLLLDELMLWLRMQVSNRDKLRAEAPKLTKLVESSHSAPAVPIYSFIAQQHELDQWVSSGPEAGAEQEAFAEALRYQSGRIRPQIALGDENLPYIANKRLLQPRDEAARIALADAFARLDRDPQLWDVLLDGVNSDVDHRGSDAEAFRLTYPFSPALISTLRDLASVMQRERTALMVMQQMLSERADTLTIDNVIPVGDCFDYIVTDAIAPAASHAVAERFKTAKRFWQQRLRPTILRAADLDENTPENALPPGVSADMRIAKTLILSSVAPGVPALKEITAARLAKLNHGSMIRLLPRDDISQVQNKIRRWAADIPEIHHSTDPDPVITVSLDSIDYEKIIDRFRGEDTDGRRRELIRDLLSDYLGVADSPWTNDRTLRRKVVWRGTEREVEIVYGNVRDPASLPDDAFYPSIAGALRLVVDYPFDDPGHTTAEDHDRVARLDRQDRSRFTVVWLPGFFPEELTRKLGRLVIVNRVLTGENWVAARSELPEADRQLARAQLESHRAQLRNQIASGIAVAYGIAAGAVFDEDQPPLRSLHSGFAPRVPIGNTLVDAADRLITAAFDAVHPDHPEFPPSTQLIKRGELALVLAALREAGADPDHRFRIVDPRQRAAVDRIVAQLELAKTNDTHLLFRPEHFATWGSRITQALARNGISEEDDITVAEVRVAITTDGDRRGLTNDMVDLIVAAWAIQTTRSWYLHGTALKEEPRIGDIHADTSLRRDPLPERSQWLSAREYWQEVMGEFVTEHLTAVNLAEFVRLIRLRTPEKVSAARDLVSALTRLYHGFGLDQSIGRLALARSVSDWLTTLTRTDDALSMIERVASAEFAGSVAQAAQLLSSALDVTDAANRVDLDRFHVLSRQAGSDHPRAAVAQQIMDDLLRAIVDSNDPNFVPAVAKADAERQRWLEVAAQNPEPQPAPDPRPATEPAATHETGVSGPRPETQQNHETDAPEPRPEPAPEHRPASRRVFAGRGQRSAIEAYLEQILVAHPMASISISWDVP